MDQATIYADDPAAQARRFIEAGFSWVHMVDLDGAFAGKPANAAAVRAIIAAVPGARLQLGGGIRSMATAEAWLNAGVSRIILGSAAVKDPDFARAACRAFPGRVALGIDARDGMVATEGWAETSDVSATDLARPCRSVRCRKPAAIPADPAHCCASPQAGLLVVHSGWCRDHLRHGHERLSQVSHISKFTVYVCSYVNIQV